MAQTVINETVIGVGRDGETFRKMVERVVLTNRQEIGYQVRMGRSKTWATQTVQTETRRQRTVRDSVVIDKDEAESLVNAAKDQNLINLDQVRSDYVSETNWIIYFNF